MLGVATNFGPLLFSYYFTRPAWAPRWSHAGAEESYLLRLLRVQLRQCSAAAAVTKVVYNFVIVYIVVVLYSSGNSFHCIKYRIDTIFANIAHSYWIIVWQLKKKKTRQITTVRGALVQQCYILHGLTPTYRLAR